MLSSSIHGQPIYDSINKHGKIICCNKQTFDFWIKWIPFASTKVGQIKLKAWTSQEYKCKNAIYSCLIPKSSVIGVDVEERVSTYMASKTLTVWSDVTHPTL